MKKCYNIKTWEEQKYVLIDLSEKNILIPTYHLTERKLEKMQQSTPTDPILAKLCELTGAKMYGDYVVLSYFTGIGETLKDEIVYTQGNIYKILMQQDKPIEQRNSVDYINGKITDEPSTVMIGFYNGNHELIGDGGGYYIDIRKGSINIIYYLNNAFEEYSKHLRNEENKFKEIKQLLNL